MADYQIVHKVLYGISPETTVAMAKFADKENMKDIRFFVGTLDCHIEDVGILDLQNLLTEGVEIAKDSLTIFLTKDDYDEHDLLGEDEDQVAIRILD